MQINSDKHNRKTHRLFCTSQQMYISVHFIYWECPCWWDDLMSRNIVYSKNLKFSEHHSPNKATSALIFTPSDALIFQLSGRIFREA